MLESEILLSMGFLMNVNGSGMEVTEAKLVS